MGEVVRYRSWDGQEVFDARLDREAVWLNYRQMADLFGKHTDTIGLHVRIICNKVS